LFVAYVKEIMPGVCFAGFQLIPLCDSRITEKITD